MCSNNPPSFLPRSPLASSSSFPSTPSAHENLSHPSPPPHSQDLSSSSTSASMLLDVTTIQGLLLYTLYLLHRLGFFRWRRDTQRISLLCQGLFLRLKPTDGSSSSSSITADLVGSSHHSDEQGAGIELGEHDTSRESKTTEETTWAETDTATTTTHTSLCINDILPPEILVLIFDRLRSPCQPISPCSTSWPSLQQQQQPYCHSHFNSQRQGRTLRRCMLVCRSWYGLIGPRIWKYPRVLWSRHWSRFYPIVPSTSQFHSQQHERLHRSLKEPDHGEGSNIGQHLFPRPKDPPELLALSQDELHELDRQELEDWVMWTKQERNQRAKDHRRRKLFRKKSSGNQTSGLWRSTSVERQEQTPRTQADTDPRLSGENMALGQAYGDTNGHLADYDDDDLESDSMSEEGTSDEEGSLMRLVSGIDRLQSMIRSHLASTEDPTSLTPIATSPACSSVSLPMDTSTSSTSNLNLPFSKALRRLRRREALQDTRRRMTEMRGQDGLPASLPLQMCGPWIQVINLQQETPIPRRIGSQSWSYHSSSTPPMTPHNSTSRRRRQSRESLSLVQDLAQTHLGQDMQPTDDRWLSRFVSLIFRGATRELPAPTATTEPQAPPRLRSRRDSVTDRTLQTILESCPGLCRLTLSECHGITDQGLAMIRDSACVARQTLVSLHLAGCHQLTDRGIENLLADHTNSFQPTPVRLESLDLAGCFQISDQSLIPFLTQCGSKLIQLRVSDCDEISFRSVMTLAEHCSGIQWLDMARAGPLTEECLVSLANRCQDLEWLNLARCHPSDLEPAIPVSPVSGRDIEHVDEPEEEDEEEIEQDSISDTCIAQICTACPNLQLLDLSYIRTLTNASIESLSESAKNLVCLTIIGCSGITSVSLAYLARLRNTCGKLGCITMGDAQGISERDIEQIMQGTLSGWQKSLVDETNLGEILGRSWDE